jgi:hypothetical protein
VLHHPDHNRKIHPGPIPRIGGVPIVVAYLASFALLLLFSIQGGDIVRGLLGQVAAAVAAFAAGVGFFATRSYSHTTNGHHIANCWPIRIALSKTDLVELSREFDTQPPAIAAPFADTIGKALRAKSFEQREVAWPPARAVNNRCAIRIHQGTIREVFQIMRTLSVLLLAISTSAFAASVSDIHGLSQTDTLPQPAALTLLDLPPSAAIPSDFADLAPPLDLDTLPGFVGPVLFKPPLSQETDPLSGGTPEPEQEHSLTAFIAVVLLTGGLILYLESETFRHWLNQFLYDAFSPLKFD